MLYERFHFIELSLFFHLYIKNSQECYKITQYDSY
jgi:hypothetical protein